MILTTVNVGSNYLAKVVKLGPVIKHPNADKLFITKVDFGDVIVTDSYKEGDICVFFPIESKINPTLLSYVNAFSTPTLNKDQSKKGFFSEKCRVRAVKLRGIPSNGYLTPIEQFLNWLGIESVNNIEDLINKEFDTVEYLLEDGDYGSGWKTVLVCEKYAIQQQGNQNRENTNRSKGREPKHNRLVEGQFRFHVNTVNLKKVIWNVYPYDFISITEKLHGTSAVFSKVLVNKKLKWYEKLLKKLNVNIQDKEYGIVYSSRSVIKNKYLNSNPEGWYQEDLWGEALKTVEHALEEGISIYAEIVGFTKKGRHIQKGYDYGCEPGTFKVYVYRITYTSPNGNVIEFTTNQIKRYCLKHDLEMVPLHYYGEAMGLFKSNFGASQLEEWQGQLLDYLINHYTEKLCGYCKNKVPAEGIVLTVEGTTYTPYKLKSFAFLEQETKMLDQEEPSMEE